MNDHFESWGIDVIKATEIMDALGFDIDELALPNKFNQIKDIVKFFENVDNPGRFISKMVMGKNVVPIDHVWAYTELIRERIAKEEELGGVIDQIERLSILPEDKHVLNDKYNELSSQVSGLESDAKLYL